MARGGKREGAGRPKGVRNKRHKVVVADPTGLMPIEWMLAVLRDPEAEQQRRDQMAALAAPYVHARLNAVAVSEHSRNSRDNSDTNIVQILSVPRGSRVHHDANGGITIDGKAAELESVTPYQGTPALELTDQRDHNDQRAEPERERFETVEPEPPQNITVLNPHGRRQRDDDDQGPAGAA